ncbi:ankyrin repeat and BTB/POZ domain-containing protein 1-like isoform X2 [Mercenaria mercenaria]|nr:ankyrin repeat and BTB/POZ domain-containing protein 1-like isoform X2 [Mercenaria mercenaria]
MVSSKVMRRDLYEEFLRRLSDPGMYQDVTFDVHGEKFPVHRCILSARSSYFADLFRTRWKGRKEIKLKHQMIFPGAFKQIVQYLYSGQMEIPVDEIEPCITLAKQCKMDKLIELIEQKCKKLASFESSKPGINITTVLVEETDKWQLQLHFGSLADIALPEELCSIATGELPFEPEFASVYADIQIVVEGHKFYCHKVFFCGRSDYFRALVHDHFGECWTSEEQLPVLELHNISVEIFVKVMYYLYQDYCELSEDNVYDVLCAADMFLLPGLKRFCANAMAKFLTVNDVVTVLRTARLFNLPRLEDQCAEFIAKNLDQVLQLEEFADLVKSDASEVQDREETDSIDIIDSIRFHITSFIQTYTEMQDAEESLKTIDEFLETLGLEC